MSCATSSRPTPSQRSRWLTTRPAAGVTRRTAVLDAINDRAEREMLRMRGIVGGDEVRSLPTATRARRRLSWLSINIVLNVIAASVIALFIDTLDQVIALAVFLPIISDMSGRQRQPGGRGQHARALTRPGQALRGRPGLAEGDLDRAHQRRRAGPAHRSRRHALGRQRAGWGWSSA